MEKTFNTVTKIFKEVFDDDFITLKKDTTADDIEDWDSLTHVQLIVAIEKHFNIRFTALEIQSFKNIGGICDSIKAKCAQTPGSA